MIPTQAFVNKRWLYSDSSGEVRSLSLDELVETLSTYSATELKDVLVWREGFSEWRPVKDVPELSQHAPELVNHLRG
jgi:hypothetical protein